MPKPTGDRLTAQIDGDFVVFLIGMRINRFWKFTKWVPAFLAMPRMLKELSMRGAEETGFLGYTTLGFGNIVQYWRSFDHLHAYANSKEGEHFPAWAAYNKRMINCRDAVGVWHESYAVKAGNYETLYMAMPPFGLGKASSTIPANGSLSSARKRFESDQPQP